MPQAYAQGQWPWQVENPQTGFSTLRDVPFAGPTSVHFADPEMAGLGLAGLRLLPTRVQEFLLKHPDPVAVRPFSAGPNQGVGRFMSYSRGEHPPYIELDPANANPGIAAEELLHAADYLKSRFTPSLGEAASGTAAARLYNLGRRFNVNPDRETFIAPTIRDQGPVSRLYESVFALLRDPATREHLLDALSTLNAGP